MPIEKVTGWQVDSSSDIRAELIHWINYLLRYLHRRYRPNKIINWPKAKPIIIGRIKAYNWARERISACHSASEYERTILASLDELRNQLERTHDYTAECNEVINRAIALNTVLLLVEDNRLRQLAPESDIAWKLLFPPDSELPD
jgi:hypothetical protein